MVFKRRTILKTIPVVGIAGCTSSSGGNGATSTPTATFTEISTATPTETSTAAPTDTPTATPTDTPTATPTETPTPRPTTEAADSELDRELERLREATSQYGDTAVAENDGYSEGDYWCSAGLHYNDPERREDGGPELLEPEAIQYGLSDGWQPMLAGVEYQILEDQWEHGRDEPPDLFSDEEVNLQVSEAEGWRFIDALGGTWVLDVWVHMPNPNGVFSPCHPNPAFHRGNCREFYACD